MSKTILKSGFVLERKEIKNERKLESYALQISSYRCIRYNDTDTILIRLKPNNEELISTDNIFPDGATVVELYTGQIASVNNGFVSFPKYENKIAIIKELKSINK